MDVNKHRGAVYLQNEPFRVTSYLRAVTDDLVSRFSSAEQGQTNLDLLKAQTQKSFRGGMFQRIFEDPEKVSLIENAYFNKVDGRLYPTPKWGDYSTIAGDLGSGGIYDWCFLNDSIYCSFQYANPSNTGNNGMFKFNPITEVVTGITLPSGLIGAGCPLKLTTYGDNIFIGAEVSSSFGTTAYRYDGVSTFTSVSGEFQGFQVFNDTLYGISNGANLHQITNATSTPITFGAAIGRLGPKSQAVSSLRPYHGWSVFNNALYIAMESGLYRFDGVKVYAVLDYTTSVDIDNFKHITTFNGRLYYTIKNKLFQFDGINIEEIQDFSSAYVINYIVGGVDRLWISTTTDTGVPYSDKFSTLPTTYYHSVFCYNGIGFYLYRAFDELLLPLNYTRLTLIPSFGKIFAFQPDMYLNPSLEPRSNGYRKLVLDLDHEFSNSGKYDMFRIVSSEIDNNYPSVTKTLNGLMLNYFDLTSGEGVFSIDVQFFDNGEWSEWQEAWSSLFVDPTAATADYLLHDESDFASPGLHRGPASYYLIRFRITFTATTEDLTTLPNISDFTLRYSVQPRLRYKWLLTLDLSALDSRHLTTPLGTDGLPEDRSSSYLRSLIYDAFRNKLPILFYDADYSSVVSLDPLVIRGTNFIANNDAIAIQNPDDPFGSWINRKVRYVVYSGLDDSTELSLLDLGYRSSIGGAEHDAAITPDMDVRRSHAVYIKNIRNERYIVDPNTLNDNSGQSGYSDIPSEITIELVEV